MTVRKIKWMKDLAIAIGEQGITLKKKFQSWKTLEKWITLGKMGHTWKSG